MTINYESLVLQTLADLRDTALFQQMAETVEDSPWHREANVLVHTEMVLSQYIKLTNAARGNNEWTYHDYLGGMCCIWHDAGKPASRIPKHSEERGDFFAYHGHETISARLFENWAYTNKVIDGTDIFIVEWMIQHHMPWSITNNQKLADLKSTMYYFGGSTLFQAYCRALLADQYGRIADKQEEKNQSANQWVKNLTNIYYVKTRLSMIDQPKKLVMPIGPSGAGKSTLFKKYTSTMAARNIESYSLDALRHEFYDTDDYSIAYEQSVSDLTFEARTNARFMERVRLGVDLYIDNTNLSVKRRAFYITEARKRGYWICGVHILSSLDELTARQTTRNDKCVPTSAVHRQYMSLIVPSIGEFDTIVIV